MRRTVALLAALALVLALAPTASLAAPAANGTWIVELRDGVSSAAVAQALARQHGGQVGHVYTHALNGFSFRGSQSAATALLRNPNVAGVEADAEVWLDTTQTSATWGLDRIDQRNRPLDGSYTYDLTGAGVNAYVIDSGIRYSHGDFGGRAVLGHDVVGGINPAGSDCNGHGTHVAGTIGGATWGVAKHVKLHSIRVFGCSSSSSWEVIIAGIDWVTGNHVKPAVANLSIGGPGSSMVDTAVQNMIDAGVATAVAAGNGDWLGRQANACNYSPARVPDAMTVSATSSTDAKASWANYGSCVDWFAPGVSIVSASHSSDSGSATKSGTSMASPHTAGVTALYLQPNPAASPTAVRNALYDATTKGIVTSSSTTNNHLLYMGFLNGGSPPPDENSAPVADDVTARGDENSTIPWTPSVSDADAGDDLACSIGAQSTSGGTATVAADCTSGTFTPAPNFTGTATFTYVVSDGEDTGSGTVTVTVDDVAEPPPSGTFALTLTGSSAAQGSSWTSIVTVSASSGSTALAGVAISGSWSNGGSAGCTTDTDGTCTISRSQHKRIGSVTFTVTGATHATDTWDGGPDSVTIAKP